MSWGDAAKVLFGMALCCALGLPVTADPFSIEYSGDWSGRGAIVTKFDGPTRAGQCRIKMLETGDPDQLHLEGFCAVAAGRSTLVLRVFRLAKTRLKAGFRAQGMDATAQYVGNYDTKRMSLKSKSPFTIDGQNFHSRITIAFRNDGRFELNNWIRPENGSGPERQVVSMTFWRQGPGS